MIKMTKVRIVLAAGLIFGASTLVSGGASATPLLPDSGIATAADLAQGGGHIIPVFGGCGPYRHRGPWGGCRPGGQWGRL